MSNQRSFGGWRIGNGILFVAVLVVTPGWSQDDESGRGLGANPWKLSLAAKQEMADQLRWELTRSERFGEQLQKQEAVLHNELTEVSTALEQTEAQGPIQFRFLDQVTRSQLVGKCLEQLLDAELELAANEAMAEMLGRETEAPLGRHSRIQILETQLKNADAKLQFSKTQLDRASELRDRGMIPETELAQIQASHLDAETQLQILRLELQAAQDESQRPRQGERLADLHVKNSALRAKIAAANRFLNELAQSSDIEKQVRVLRSRFGRLEQALDVVTRELEETDLGRMRINSLLDLYSQESPAKEEKK